MTRRRLVVVLLAAVVAIGVAGIAVLPGEASDDDAATTTAPTVAAPTSTTTTSPPTTTTTVPLPPLPAGGLHNGSQGPEVLAFEERLVQRHYDPGDVDGKFDGETAFAVMALEKVAGMEPTGRVEPPVWEALATIPDPAPMLPDGGDERVEVDLVRQLLFLYNDGGLRLISHVSTGSGKTYCSAGRCGKVAVTPGGSHRFLWRVNGWRKSRLGRLYNPVYFTKYGIAVHGFPSVPTSPASHGCVRIPMHTAEWFPGEVERGDPVYVFDGKGTPVLPLPPFEETEAPVPEDAEGRLDGDPPPTSPTTEPAGQLA